MEKLFLKIACRLNFLIHRERKVCYGEDNSRQVFYVIGIDYKTEGLFAIIKNVLIHIEYAVHKGYVPVVDMCNYSSQFNKVNKWNAWELFFKQPSGFSLDDVKTSKNVILSRNVKVWPKHSFSVEILDHHNKIRFEKLKNIYNHYIVPNNKLYEYSNNLYNEKIGGRKNVLGILCRGTDYTQKKPKNHPVQPSFEQLVNTIDSFIKSHKVDYMYVATEEQDLLNKFLDKYGNKIIYIKQHRFGQLKANYISDLGINAEQLVKMNMDYYSSLYILSKCDYLIAGRTAGTIGVFFMTEGFKESYCFDLGYYE